MASSSSSNKITRGGRRGNNTGQGGGEAGPRGGTGETLPSNIGWERMGVGEGGRRWKATVAEGTNGWKVVAGRQNIGWLEGNIG